MTLPAPRTKTAKTPATGRRADGLADLLSRSVILEEAAPPHAVRQLIIGVTILVVGLAIWAATGRIAETTTAPGQVIPAGSVQQVQHLEGGILAALLVQDGVLVEAGEVLARMAPANAGGELDQLRARQAAVLFQLERLHAFVDDREPNFPEDPTFAELRFAQSAALAVQREADASQRQVLAARITQRKAEMASISAQRDALERQAGIVREEAGLRRRLLDKGLVSRLSFLESERIYAAVEGELAVAIKELARAQAARDESEIAFVEFEANKRQLALQEISELTGQLAELRESVARLGNRVGRLEITAPTDGIVQGLATQTIGAVLAPGAVLMEIVPVADSMVAEVRIKPRDIGQITVGQAADVTITAFDPAQFGSLTGNIEHISPSTFVSEEGEPFYRAIIRLDADRLGSTRDNRPNLILPGMVVSAAISTGDKTLFQYMASPIFRALDGSFAER